MHCPLCGSEVTRLERKRTPPPEITYDKPMGELTELHERWNDYLDPNKQPEYWDCETCDITWIQHNPYRGIDSTPTDNWSVSYIK